MNAELIEQRKAELRALEPNTKIYCEVLHVSSSGMSRRLKMWYIKDNEMHVIHIDDPKNFETMYKPRGQSYPEFGVYTVGGCGMDMTFALVYNLGWYIWKGHEDELKAKCKAFKKKNKDAYMHDSLLEGNNGGYYFKKVNP